MTPTKQDDALDVVVGHVLVDQCLKFGQKVVDGYAAGRKNHSRDLAIKGKPRIDGDVKVQAMGRIAECGACLHFGLDPMKALNWKGACDDGYDFSVRRDGLDVKVDVKASSHPGAKRLIWPASKMHFLKDAADVLLFARVPIQRCNSIGQVVELCGWATKEYFISSHSKSKGEDGLVPGTAYMFEKDLYAMSKLT